MKDDKFVLMGMNDSRSKKIAEVLGNKTCKKILDYLTDFSEKSEEDIAKALGLNMNTVEYNLKKLLESGLVEKTKNFFWSKRGKKIPLYKTAKKHIVISPKYSKPNLTVLKTIIPVIIAIAFVLVLINIWPQDNQTNEGINNFNSIKELKDFIKDNQVSSGSFGYRGMLESATGVSKASSDTSASPSASDYSTTNIQVQGVDEADIIKNDGKYIYTVSNSENKITIIDAYPAEDMKILSEISFEEKGYIDGIFINDDKLIVLTREYASYGEVRCMAIDVCPLSQEPRTLIYIYDISNRGDPEIQDKISVSGDYINSRMIGDYVYIIANQYIYDDVILPSIINNGNEEAIDVKDISYSDFQDYSFQFTTVLAININNGETSNEVSLTGSSYNIYVSKDNIYTTYTKYQNWYEDIVDNEKTIINKISIDKDEIEYLATGEVQGHILNQFSMDEYESNFRIATTTGSVWGSEDSTSKNNVYVLDKDLTLVGKLEGLAPGEKIYSVRFMGERAYVVTFKKVDPLFVIDLSNPEDPDVLGKLKIPGYSDYLHPYDENHIIGVGKEAVEAEDDLKEQRSLDFAWYQGIKIAIFDVSDVENPVEMHKVVIGDRGTDSEALHNHKAFLFDREKELLVLPIALAEIQGEKTSDNQYGEHVFQGAYVYNINLEDGFELKGKITHYNEDEVEKKSGYYAYRGDRNVRRSLYMDNTLYTISNEIIKANDLDNLKEINYVEVL